MRMFYCIMKGVESFAANFLSYIPTKYYYNWSTSDLVIVTRKPCYRKDDRAMLPIYGCPEKFRESSQLLFPKFVKGFCSDRY